MTRLPFRLLSHRTAAAVVAALVAVAPAAARAGDATASAQVRIADFRFAPAVLEVRRGTEVRWVNEDEEPHTVTADGGAFASRGLDAREVFAVTLSRPGTYRYHCALHPQMSAVVVVR